jgi:hypothetical protein
MMIEWIQSLVLLFLAILLTRALIVRSLILVSTFLGGLLSQRRALRIRLSRLLLEIPLTVVFGALFVRFLVHDGGIDLREIGITAFHLRVASMWLYIPIGLWLALLIFVAVGTVRTFRKVPPQSQTNGKYILLRKSLTSNALFFIKRRTVGQFVESELRAVLIWLMPVTLATIAADTQHFPTLDGFVFGQDMASEPMNWQYFGELLVSVTFDELADAAREKEIEAVASQPMTVN